MKINERTVTTYRIKRNAACVKLDEFKEQKIVKKIYILKEKEK